MENHKTIQFNDTDIVIASLVYSLVLVIGTCGNLILLISILFRREARRIQSNVFLISLSLTDLLTSTICGPYYLRSLHVSEFIPNEGTKPWLCSIMLVSVYFLAIESILSLALMSLDRFFAVRMPFLYQRMVTKRSCIVATCSCWIYGIVTLFPPFLKSDWVIYENSPGSPCGFKWEEASTLYIAINFLLSFLIPAIVICITNVLVYKTAKEQNRKIKRSPPVHQESATLSRSNFPPSKAYKSSVDLSKPNLEGEVPCHTTAVRNEEAIDQASSGRLAFISVAENPILTTTKNFPSVSSGHQTNLPRKLRQPDGIGATYKPNSYGTEYKPDDIRTHCKPDGIGTDNKPDGIGTDNKPDGIGTEYKPDGVGSEYKPDGMGTEYKPANIRTHFKIDGIGTEYKHEADDGVTLCNSSSIIQSLNEQNHHARNFVERHSTESKGNTGKCKFLSPINNTRERSGLSKVKTSPNIEMKLVLATISISIGFFISWMPFVVPRFLIIVSKISVPDRVMNYGIVVSAISSAWNPYIILLTRKEILLGFKKVMKQLRNKVLGKEWK